MIDLAGKHQPRLLVRHALGDIAQDHCPEPLAIDLDLRDRGFDGEFLTIGAQAVDRAERPHAPAGDAGIAEAVDVHLMRFAIPFRDEARDRLAERVFLPDTEHQLGGGIEENDILVLIDSDDRTVDDTFQPAFGLGQFACGFPLGRTTHNLLPRYAAGRGDAAAPLKTEEQAMLIARSCGTSGTPS
jgi:hypothetical protein